MPIVAGVDFGTLSVRVTLFDSERGRLATASAEYPLHRMRDDPDFATQSHTDQMNALVKAMRSALAEAKVDGADVKAIALDTTGSSVIPVGEKLEPLGEYYLWCDHRAHHEAAEITALAHAEKLEAIEWCGGVYSHEWGFAKLLHWLRHHPELRDQFVSAFEHCDMVAATLAGISNAKDVKRSVCAMGHKWLWNAKWGGFPSQAFLSQVDPLFDGIREKLTGECLTSDKIAGHLSPRWAEAMGLKAGIPIPVGAFDAHWDAIGAGCREGDVVNVVGTSTCIIAMSKAQQLIRGVCGVVPGSVHPTYTGIEAGLSAVGDIFESIARRANRSLAELSAGLGEYRPAQTGLMRLTWDNGDRTVLVNSALGGVTFGWNLLHTAEDELFAAIEGTALHTRIILERMAEGKVPIERVINAGGIPQKNDVLNQIYADVLNKPVLVPAGVPTSLGSSIFAFVAAGIFPSIESAQKAVCLPHKTFTPRVTAVRVYDELFKLFRQAYFALGSQDATAVPMGDLLPELRRLAQESRDLRAE
jgi:L-ribulokinase